MTTFLITPDTEMNLRAQRDAIWNRLPAFNLQAALAGAPYLMKYDVLKQRAWSDVREIAAPNPGWMVWAGEWTFYELADGETEMWKSLRMYNAAAWEGLEL